MTAIVVVERAVSALVRARRDYIVHRYQPFVRGALAGDDAAVGRLVAAPARHHLGIARLLVEPLIDDRDPALIARTRAIVIALSIVPIADRVLRSWLWWRRAVALRALGVLQLRDHTAAVIAALDDPHPDVRAAALDALTACTTSRRFAAVVVRLHDASLHPARRLAALAAFGPECEEFLLELSAGRRRAPGQLRARARDLRHAPVAPGARAMDARRASRGPRSRVRSARARGAGRRSRPAWPSRRSRAPTHAVARDGRVRTERAGQGSGDAAARLAPAPRRRLAGGRARGAVAPLDGQRRRGSNCRRRRRAPISPGCSRVRCCRRRAHDADGDRELRVARVQRDGHRALRAVERVADGDEPRSPCCSSRVTGCGTGGDACALAARLASPPFVSVIVPAYNEELTIVESVRALLLLDYAAREIIVVNDGSSDGTLAALARHVSARAGAGGVRAAVEDRGGAGDVPVGQRARARRRRQGERRQQVGRGERRVQRGVRDARAEHRRRHRARARRAEPRGDPVPRGPVDGGGRRQHRDQQRLPHRERPHHWRSRCREAGWRGFRSSSTCGPSCCSGSPARRRTAWC